MSVLIRKQMIDLVKRRTQPGTGSLHSDWRKKQMSHNLLQNWAVLASELSPFEYAVAGGLAVGVYAPERATQDIDIVIVSSIAIEEKFLKLGYRPKGKLAIGGMIWEMNDGREIDILDISDRPWAKMALYEAQSLRFMGFPILPLPYLVLMKLEASRMQDVADISRLVKYADEQARKQIRETVRTYRPQDLEDLEQIIQIEDYL